ncbi:MAG: hypothetical protein VKP72_10340 [bacterium]|nr:hypothetical protein [bacterium]
MRARVRGAFLAVGFALLVAACSDLGRIALPLRVSASATPDPAATSTTDVVLPGMVGGISGTTDPASPTPTPSLSPSVSLTPTTEPTSSLPPSLRPTVTPSGPYGGLEAVDLVIEPSTLAIGVKTPPAITPVLPDTGVLTATVTLRGGGISSRVTWKSASPGVMSIDENGVCRALDERPQRVQVTATTLDGRLERVVFVELRDRAQVEIILDDTEAP